MRDASRPSPWQVRVQNGLSRPDGPGVALDDPIEEDLFDEPIPDSLAINSNLVLHGDDEKNDSPE